MKTYTVTRMYFSDFVPNETIATGLTLEEAREHCSDPETSSSTCSEQTLQANPNTTWFDGYDEE